MNPDGPYRLRALWRDDPTAAPMTIDLQISEGRISACHDLFGAFDLDGDVPRPFVLRRDGLFVFGGADACVWRTDLRDAEIAVGCCFSIHFNDRDHGVYRIVKLARPGSKETR
jgi:hypothetical protein